LGKFIRKSDWIKMLFFLFTVKNWLDSPTHNMTRLQDS
jgi:hypothetical protein